MIGLALEPDGPWVEVDLAAPPREWAADTVSRRWAAQRSFPAPPGLTLEALGAQLCVPEELLERPRRRSVVETGSGLAVRLVQRYREPGGRRHLDHGGR